MSNLSTRSELLFLYEIENANPNGDPLNENRPRYDTEDARALVSDVRLKRTIRDYWYAYKGYNGENGKDIFVRETEYEGEGKNADKTFISDGKRRAKSFMLDSKSKKVDKDAIRRNILDQCIDVRTFGGVIPLPNDSITLTGPTQFQMGKSLHATSVETIQGTGAFASGDNKTKSTFRTEYVLPYALIGFNGIVNEHAAQLSEMTAADRDLLLEGIWEGTKNVISRSKFGQTPMFLLHVEYEPGYYVGNLRQRIGFRTKNDRPGVEVRGTEDYHLDLTKLFDALKAAGDKVKSVHLRHDNRLDLRYGTGEDNRLELSPDQKIDLNALV